MFLRGRAWPLTGHARLCPVILPAVSSVFQPCSFKSFYICDRPEPYRSFYGNEVAIRAVRARSELPGETRERPAYPSNSVLALVIWTQRDDPHWFGARIPGTPQSVEFVEVGHTTGYRKFAGTGLAEVHVSAVSAAERMSFVAGLTPVQLP